VNEEEHTNTNGRPGDRDNGLENERGWSPTHTHTQRERVEISLMKAFFWGIFIFSKNKVELKNEMERRKKMFSPI
jgi:hypothetical protein